jgi:hypothetical protein
MSAIFIDDLIKNKYINLDYRMYEELGECGFPFIERYVNDPNINKYICCPEKQIAFWSGSDFYINKNYIAKHAIRGIITFFQKNPFLSLDHPVVMAFGKILNECFANRDDDVAYLFLLEQKHNLTTFNGKYIKWFESIFVKYIDDIYIPKIKSINTYDTNIKFEKVVSFENPNYHNQCIIS